MVWSEGNMSLKIPVTPPGIDPETVRLVAQRLNHYATPGPRMLRPFVFIFFVEVNPVGWTIIPYLLDWGVGV